MNQRFYVIRGDNFPFLVNADNILYIIPEPAKTGAKMIHLTIAMVSGERISSYVRRTDDLFPMAKGCIEKINE